MNENLQNTAFGWDDVVENTDREFELMPVGDYGFTVTNFTRGWYEPKPGGKLPACAQAELELSFDWFNAAGQPRSNKLTYRLQLCQSMKWKIFQMFQGIGLVPEGDKQTQFPWNRLIGTGGIAAIGQFTGQNGKVFNSIEKIYTPTARPTVYANKKTEEASDIPF